MVLDFNYASTTLVALVTLVLVAQIGCRSTEPFPPQLSVPVFHPSSPAIVFSHREGENDCFLYVADLGTHVARRLSHAKSGCETDPAISSDGELIAFARSSSAGRKSAIVLRKIDGGTERVLVSSDDDNSQPEFDPSSRRVFFLRAKSFTHSSPLVDNHRQNFDVYSVTYDGKVDPITRASFYSVSSFAVSPRGNSILLSAYGDRGSFFGIVPVLHPDIPLQILQPRVSGQPSSGPTVRNAVWLPDAAGILFSAASQRHGISTYDYNIYSLRMSTREVSRLTNSGDVIEGFSVHPDGSKAILVRGAVFFILDLRTYIMKEFPVSYAEGA